MIGLATNVLARYLEKEDAEQAALLLVRARKPGKAGFTDALMSQIAQAHGCDRTLLSSQKYSGQMDAEKMT